MRDRRIKLVIIVFVLLIVFYEFYMVIVSPATTVTKLNSTQACDRCLLRCKDNPNLCSDCAKFYEDCEDATKKEYRSKEHTYKNKIES